MLLSNNNFNEGEISMASGASQASKIATGGAGAQSGKGTTTSKGTNRAYNAALRAAGVTPPKRTRGTGAASGRG